MAGPADDLLADQRRTDRGFPSHNGDPAFTIEQRTWLLERDLDAVDERFTTLGNKMDRIERLMSTRLNALVAIGFSLLVAVIAALVTASVH